jgi:hypothetical protein
MSISRANAKHLNLEQSTMRNDLTFIDAELIGHDAPAASSWLGSLRARLVASIVRRADHYAAATVYAELSKLSDAELARRGLSRDVLARDL